MTVKQVAEYFGVHPNSIYNWIDAGVLPHIRHPGGHYRIREKDIEEYERRIEGNVEWHGHGQTSDCGKGLKGSLRSSDTIPKPEPKSGFRAALAMR